MIKNLCCQTFSDLVRLDEIGYDPLTGEFAIHGRPNFADDGDGHSDDMTREFVITYCPFCGKNLKELREAVSADGC